MNRWDLFLAQFPFLLLFLAGIMNYVLYKKHMRRFIISMNKLNCQLAICPNTWGQSHGHVGGETTVIQTLYRSWKKNEARTKENIEVRNERTTTNVSVFLVMNSLSIEVLYFLKSTSSRVNILIWLWMDIFSSATKRRGFPTYAKSILGKTTRMTTRS